MGAIEFFALLPCPTGSTNHTTTRQVNSYLETLGYIPSFVKVGIRCVHCKHNQNYNSGSVVGATNDQSPAASGVNTKNSFVFPTDRSGLMSSIKALKPHILQCPHVPPQTKKRLKANYGTKQFSGSVKLAEFLDWYVIAFAVYAPHFRLNCNTPVYRYLMNKLEDAPTQGEARKTTMTKKTTKKKSKKKKKSTKQDVLTAVKTALEHQSCRLDGIAQMDLMDVFANDALVMDPLLAFAINFFEMVLVRRERPMQYGALFEREPEKTWMCLLRSKSCRSRSVDENGKPILAEFGFATTDNAKTLASSIARSIYAHLPQCLPPAMAQRLELLQYPTGSPSFAAFAENLYTHCQHVVEWIREVYPRNDLPEPQPENRAVWRYLRSEEIGPALKNKTVLESQVIQLPVTAKGGPGSNITEIRIMPRMDVMTDTIGFPRLKSMNTTADGIAGSGDAAVDKATAGAVAPTNKKSTDGDANTPKAAGTNVGTKGPPATTASNKGKVPGKAESPSIPRIRAGRSYRCCNRAPHYDKTSARRRLSMLPDKVTELELNQPVLKRAKDR